ncbi:MAG: hypothetical protein NZ602_02220 [Thermoguttaceae bacterium]|nr:hypothetical protein [Thermoguttaceae bacterium]MDW8039447.1 hypothetical protein [Thermoguttaceae bacterium]
MVKVELRNWMYKAKLYVTVESKRVRANEKKRNLGNSAESVQIIYCWIGQDGWNPGFLASIAKARI